LQRTLRKSDKNSKILNKLIVNGFYSGYIRPEKLELQRAYFPNNYRLIGTLNENGYYDLKLDFKSPIAAKLAFGSGILTSVIMLIKGFLLFPIIYFILPFSIIYIRFKIKEKKEINYLKDRIFDFERS